MPPINPTSNVITEQLTRALGEAVIRIWSNLPQDVQNHLFQEAVCRKASPYDHSLRSSSTISIHEPRTH